MNSNQILIFTPLALYNFLFNSVLFLVLYNTAIVFYLWHSDCNWPHHCLSTGEPLHPAASVSATLSDTSIFGVKYCFLISLYLLFYQLKLGRQILGEKRAISERQRKHSNDLPPLPSFLKESSLLCHLKQNSSDSMSLLSTFCASLSSLLISPHFLWFF